MFDARFDASDRDAVGTSHGADLKTILIMKLRDPEVGLPDFRVFINK